jgi:predicted permease
VLLIACANVANLLLARGVARARELAVRSALGAGRRRLIQQLLVETVVLALAGTALGVGIAALSLQVLVAVQPTDLPRLDQVALDLTTLLFAVGAALVTSLVIGLAPALTQTPRAPQASLTAAPRGSGTSLRRIPRAAVVVLEVALAGVLLTAAALLVRSYERVTSTPIGLDPNQVAVTRLTLARAEYDQPEKVFEFQRGMRERLLAIPGVELASAAYPLPLSASGWSGTVGVVSRPRTPGLPEPHAEFAVALPGYFQTLGVRMVEGRDFADTDTAASPAVAIVDTEFARQYFPGRSPIGERLAWNGNLDEGPFQTIVGVVGHVRNRGPRENGEGQVYFAALQKQEFSLFFVTKTATTSSSVMPAIRSAVREANPRLPIAQLTTMEGLVRTVTSRERFNAGLFLAFGLVALAIAATGLYGVLAFVVAQRTRDIGVRLALGGTPSSLVRGVVTESVLLSAVGLAVGLGTASLLSQAMDEFLFGVDPVDPISYGVITAVMLTVAVIAAWGPARRAARVDPATVLRS